MNPGRLIKKIFSLTLSAFAVLIVSGFLSLQPINEQSNVIAPNAESLVQASSNTENLLAKSDTGPLESFYRIIKTYLEGLF